MADSKKGSKERGLRAECARDVLHRRYREIEQALKSAKRKHCASLYSDNFGCSAGPAQRDRRIRR